MLDTTLSGFDLIDFEVEKRSLFDGDGNELPREMGVALTRKDTGKALSIVKDSYKPVPYMEIWAPTLQALEDEGLPVYERALDQRGLYDLKGEKGAWASVRVTGDGQKMQGSIIVADFTSATSKSGRFGLPVGDNTLFREIRVLSSHDSSLSASTDMGFKVLECFNGMRSTIAASFVRGKHTAGFSIEAFKKQVLVSAELMAQDGERFTLYAQTKCSKDQAKEFFRRTIARQPDTPSGEAAWSERLVDTLLKIFEDQPQTVWGAVQAMTYWATHHEAKAGSNPIMTQVRRDDRVVAAMRTPEFQELLAA